MYGFIFGFHRLARCPKWTPASIRSLTASATKLHPFPRENSGPRSRDQESRATVLGGIESVKNEMLSYRRDAPPSNPPRPLQSHSRVPGRPKNPSPRPSPTRGEGAILTP